jgi:hypothetical protein
MTSVTLPSPVRAVHSLTGSRVGLQTRAGSQVRKSAFKHENTPE